jgi:N-acetylglucosaminyldiphosphoundecaprenol N-acetyl-beta-D-mannosaminyltransferase
MNQRFKLGYATIDVVNQKEALERLVEMAEQGPCRYAVTPNSDHIVMLEEHEELRAVYRDAHLVLADGMPVVWASRLIGPRLPERVTGAEILPGLCAAAARRGLTVFLLGAGPGVAEKAQTILESTYPGLSVVGTYCPPLGFERSPDELEAIMKRLRSAAPHIIFVGLGAPKQEIWMHRHFRHLDRGVMLGIGAAIDFVAGTVQRAPRWMQHTGLEWLYRLVQEPRRLAKRYLRDTRILWIILREWRSRARHSPGSA